MTVVTSPPGYRIIDIAEAEAVLGPGDDIDYPYLEFADEQEFRLYPGGLRVTGRLSPESDVDWVPYNVIVDGDLDIDGDLDWWDWRYGNLLVVTGTVRARNVLLAGSANVVVRGDLLVTGGIQGHRGEDGGVLTVTGRTRAGIVVCTLYYRMTFATAPEAVVVGDPDLISCPVDFTDDDLPDVLRPELLDEDGRVAEYEVGAALSSGQPILRPGARPRHEAALADLDELLSRADEVTDVDLTNRNLRTFPAQLLHFPRLRKLSLAGNDGSTFDERLGELTTLEELDLSDLALDELPAAIGRLTRLRVLRVGRLRCRLPATLAALTALEELDLSGYRPADFPVVVTRLTALRRLDLSGSRLAAVPAGAFALDRLEQLDLSRTALADLPDDAFVRTGNLRRLNLSGTALTTLPPSFYDLARLEFVDLRDTKLDLPTVERIQAAFPTVRIDLTGVAIRGDVDDPTWQAVHALVQEGGQKLAADPSGAVAAFDDALSRCLPGASFSTYDQLYALYGAVDALGRLADVDTLIRYAERALSLVPQPGGIWHYTDEGAFQEEVTRRVGNTLAWQLLQRGELDRALSVVDRALAVAAAPEYDHIRDTKVRILLQAGRTHEAYLIVDRVLARTPGFGDFADIKESADFQRWRTANATIASP